MTMMRRRGSALTVQQLMLLFLAVVVIAVIAKFTLFSTGEGGGAAEDIMGSAKIGEGCCDLWGDLCTDGVITPEEAVTKVVPSACVITSCPKPSPCP